MVNFSLCTEVSVKLINVRNGAVGVIFAVHVMANCVQDSCRVSEDRGKTLALFHIGYTNKVSFPKNACNICLPVLE